MSQRISLILLVLAVVCLTGVMGARSAQAGAIVVSSPADSGPASLRSAILSANAGSGSDVITFDPSVFPPDGSTTIALETPLPEIDGDSGGVTIDGTNAGVVIDGSALDSGESGLVVASGNGGVGNVEIRSIAVQGAPGQGVDICGGELPTCQRDVGAVTIADLTASDNGEAGVRIRGEQVNDIEFNGCELTGNGSRGAFFHSNADMSRISVENCQADGNGNHGVYIESISAIIDVSIRDSSVSENGNLGAYFDSVEETVRPVIDNVDAKNNGAMGVGFSSAQPLTGLVFTDSSIDSNGSTIGNGLGTEVLALSISDATITGNSFSNNEAGNRVGGVGLQIYSQFEHPSGVTIANNVVKNNVGRGITVYRDTPGNAQPDVNLITENEVSGNTWDGIAIFDAIHVTISHNRVFGNEGIGINLGGGEDEEDSTGVTPNDLGDGDDGSNDLLNFPVINSAGGGSVQGTACSGCIVELFVSDNDSSGHGEGRTFIGEAVAGGGTFSIIVCGVGEGGKVTATATDDDGNTSEFSTNYTVPFATGPCEGQLRQGDVDCSGTIDGQDALLLALAAADLEMEVPGGCVALDFGSPQFGDLNCDGLVDTGDILGPLSFAGDVPFPQNSGCADLGSEI